MCTLKFFHQVNTYFRYMSSSYLNSNVISSTLEFR